MTQKRIWLVDGMKKSGLSSSESAKDRLLEAAIKIFALYGYEGAGTRQLTKEAGVNISAITYYFSDKEGLYKATLAHIAALIKKDVADKAVIVRHILERKDVSDEEYINALHDMINGFVQFLLGERLTPHAVRIFLREQMEPTSSFNVLYEDAMRPMHETLTRLIARLAGLSYPSEQATLCAHSIIGQISVFKTHREAALRRLGWKKYGDKEKEKITEIILRHTDFIISMYRKNSRRRT